MKKILLIISVIFFISLNNGITLKETVKYSLKENVTYKEAKLNKKIYNIYKNNSLLDMVPDFTASMEYDPITEDYNKSFRISQNIFYSGKEIFSYLSSKYNYDYMNNIVEKQKNEVIIETIRQYLELIKARETVNLWEVEVQKAEKDYQKAKKMYKYGNTTKLDLLESKNYFKYAKHNLDSEKNSFSLQKLEFEDFINKNIKKVEDYDFPDISIKSIDHYLEYASKESYEFKNMILKKKASKFDYISSKLNKLPSVNFFITKNYTDNNFEDFENDNLTYGVSVDLTGWFYSNIQTDYSYSDYSTGSGLYNQSGSNEKYSADLNVLSGDYTTPSIYQKKISYLKSNETIQNKKLALQKLIKKNYYNFVNSKSYFNLQKTNLKAKKERRRKKIKEYELGMVDSSEKVEAIKEYLQAEIDYLQAKYNYYINWYNLLKVSGKKIKL